MSEARLEGQGSPKGIKRWLYRAPIWFYRAKLGFLLRHRFLLLETIGHKSGKKRRAVLEVVAEEDDAVYLASAWGTKAHWHKNITANPSVTVQLGSSIYETEAEPIDADEAHRVLSKYAAAHPRALRKLANYMLDEPGETTEEHVTRVSAVIPFVRLPKP